MSERRTLRQLAAAAWSNAHLMPRSRRIFALAVIAWCLRVRFHVEGIPFGYWDEREALQQRNITDIIDEMDEWR